MASSNPVARPGYVGSVAAFCPSVSRMKFKLLLAIVLVIGAVAAPVSVGAQVDAIQLSFTPDVNQLTIGGRVNILATATYPAGFQVLFPDLP